MAVIKDLQKIAPFGAPSHGAKCSSIKNTGMRSRISAAKSSGSVTIIVQDFSRSPVSRFFHSSQSPAAISSGEPSRAVNTTACFPRGVFYNSRIGCDLPPSIQDSGRRSDRVYVGRRHFCGTKTADRIWGGVARACPKTRSQSGLQWALAHGPRWIPPKLPPGPRNK